MICELLFWKKANVITAFKERGEGGGGGAWWRINHRFGGLNCNTCMNTTTKNQVVCKHLKVNKEINNSWYGFIRSKTYQTNLAYF